MSNDKDLERAYQLGYKHGEARASWVWDGNTPTDEYHYFIRKYDEGDLPEHYLSPDALSGEWAGESVAELLGSEFPQLLNDDADVDYWHGDIPDAYEEGFQEGWYGVLVSVALTQVWTEDDEQAKV